MFLIMDKNLIFDSEEPEYEMQKKPSLMLHAMRYCVEYGLKPTYELKCNILDNADKIHDVPKTEITDEFKKIFSLNKPVKDVFLEGCFEKLLCEIIPELEPCINYDQMSKYHKHDVYEHMLSVTDLCDTTKFEIKMAAFLHDIGKPSTMSYDEKTQSRHFYGHPEVSEKMAAEILTKTFDFKPQEQEKILGLIANHEITLAENQKSVSKALNKLGEDLFRDLLVLKNADINDHVLIPNTEWIIDTKVCEKILDEVIEEQNKFSVKDLQINGKTLITELNVKSGKEIGEILNNLVQQVVDGKLVNEKENLMAAVREEIAVKKNLESVRIITADYGLSDNQLRKLAVEMDLLIENGIEQEDANKIVRLRSEFFHECNQIAEECEKEEKASHGADYESGVESIKKRYDERINEIYNEYEEEKDEGIEEAYYSPYADSAYTSEECIEMAAAEAKGKKSEQNKEKNIEQGIIK